MRFVLATTAFSALAVSGHKFLEGLTLVFIAFKLKVFSG